MIGVEINTSYIGWYSDLLDARLHLANEHAILSGARKIYKRSSSLTTHITIYSITRTKMQALNTENQPIVEQTALPWLSYSLLTILAIIVGSFFLNTFIIPRHHSSTRKKSKKSKKQSKYHTQQHNAKSREDLCGDCFVDDVMISYKKPNDLITVLEKELRRAIKDFTNSEAENGEKEAYIRDLERMNEEYVEQIRELENLLAD